MSSRLFQQVREHRGLCYSIFSFASLYSDSGVFSVYAGTSASQVNEMLTVAAEELASGPAQGLAGAGVAAAWPHLLGSALCLGSMLCHAPL